MSGIRICATNSRNIFNSVFVICLIASMLVFSGCSAQNNTNQTKINTPTTTSAPTTKSIQEVISSIDTVKYKPNETGKVFIVMFHNFVQTFKPVSGDKNGEFYITYDSFSKLLQTLYDKKYRLVSMKDYLSNNMNVPAGCTPIVFTFDDGTKGQFHLVNNGGKLEADKMTAVGIMEDFYAKHPDFGLAGVFYLNLGNESTFAGDGTLTERLQYLMDKGFELGNHTLNHSNLSLLKTPDKIQEAIGANEKAMEAMFPNYRLDTMALPYGAYNKNFKDIINSSEYQGTKYVIDATFKVGAEPVTATVVKDFSPYLLPRVRAPGMINVNMDLTYWLNDFDKHPEKRYISDGVPEVLSVPKEDAVELDQSKLNGKELNAYK